jgi:hypothetical protein
MEKTISATKKYKMKDGSVKEYKCIRKYVVKNGVGDKRITDSAFAKITSEEKKQICEKHALGVMIKRIAQDTKLTPYLVTRVINESKCIEN